jgi:dienelactone hydrolase
MSKLVFLCAALATFTASATAQQNASQTPAPQDFQSGVLIAKVSCAAQPDQSYALYLPSHYSREKRWPIFYVFDPDALGSRPVELMKDAAERYGYIVAGSNNSHNGPWKLEADAAQAIVQDTNGRLSIDSKRAYFAGFSGGARFASSLAQRCKCAAGVLMNSAGFWHGSPPAPDGPFSVFATAGIIDFNYSEVVTLNAKLGALRYSHAFREFDGRHQWAPASVMDEAFAWFRLIAMKDGHEERDMAFVKEQAADAEKRAKALELAGDSYGAWKEYRQDADTFEGFGDDLGEAKIFRERAVALEEEKAVRDGAKREQQEFDEQSRLIADISSGLSTLLQDAPNQRDQRDDLGRQISALSSRAEHEKNPEKLRVLERALGSIFVQAMEAGDERYEAKDFSRACTFYELGANAETDSAWAWRVVAAARAMTADRKGTFDAIRHAKERSKDLASFSAWLKEEPAFAKFRETPEFRALLASAQESEQRSNQSTR